MFVYLGELEQVSIYNQDDSWQSNIIDWLRGRKQTVGTKYMGRSRKQKPSSCISSLTPFSHILTTFFVHKRKDGY